MLRPCLFAYVLLLNSFALSILATRVQAESLTYGGELYQQQLIADAMAREHLVIDPSPQGKTIEGIVVVPYDVFLKQDPWPEVFNDFHVTTLPTVVKREMIFHEGDRWNDEQVEESARNIRNYLFISLGRIVPVRGSEPDRVKALIVTKDLWSLRLNMDFSYVGTKLEHLDFQLSEHNLLGRTKRATVDLGLDLATWYVGAQYRDPRLLGSEVLLQERADLITNRTTGILEGGIASFSMEQPLYTLDTPWAWVVALAYRRDFFRLFTGGDLAQISVPVTGELLPYLFHREKTDFKLGVTRSYGHFSKRDFSAGYRAFAHNFYVPPPQSNVQPLTVSAFTSSVVPRTESAGLLFVGFHGYRGEFQPLININTFALDEDFRLGPDVGAELRFASRAFGFSSSFIEPVVSLDSTWLSGDDLFNVGAGLDIRYQPEALPGLADWVDGNATIHVRNVSPRWGFLRLHSGLRATRRYNNLDRDFSTLGGDGSMRGFPSAYFYGANVWVGNLELRTLPIAVATFHFGLVSFLDVGAASNTLDQLGPHASTGLGLRVLFPQFNREVLRVDLGFPLEQVIGADPAYFVAKYGQAF